jgi:hypothetical protein
VAIASDFDQPRRATRPATERTFRGAANQMAIADSRLQKIPIQKAMV